MRSHDDTSQTTTTAEQNAFARTDVTLSSPEVVEIKDRRCGDLPPLIDAETVDNFSSGSKRFRWYRSMTRVWYALCVWGALLAISLSKARVADSDIHLDLLLNTTVFPQFEHHWSRIQQSMKMPTSDRELPGEKMAKDGAKAHFPIVMIPGFVTSGLELWEGEECARKYFRQRLWGALGTARSFFTETECWRRHLSLDPISGLDPPGIRLRAAQGFEAADYFMTAYWVWNKLIENLAAVGYDGSTMTMESYDWRLAYPLLEERDGYFTNLRHKIEAMHHTNGKKVVIAAHSMGAPLMTYFFAWVTTPESEGGGGGGKKWVEKHVHALVNIAGPMLGVPKAVPSILSGEMKDTNVLMGTFGSMVEQFFGRRRRKALWSSWGSLWAMLPKGGKELWDIGADFCAPGTSPDRLRCVPSSETMTNATVPFVSFTDEDEVLAAGISQSNCTRTKQQSLETTIEKFSGDADWTVDKTLEFLADWGVGHGPQHAGARYNSLHVRENKLSPRDWSDPTRTPLPFAPTMKIYCFYGVGIETERAFFYKRNIEESENNETQCLENPVDLPFVMDGSVEDEAHNIKYGVKLVDGDASVPLLSLGYMCVDGWQRPNLNPSASRVITREYLHHQEFHVDDPMRGGPKSADHVDILGNVDMTEDFLRIVTDFDSSHVRTSIVSDIENIAKRVNAHPQGGLDNRRRLPFVNRVWPFSRN